MELFENNISPPHRVLQNYGPFNLLLEWSLQYDESTYAGALAVYTLSQSGYYHMAKALEHGMSSSRHYLVIEDQSYGNYVVTWIRLKAFYF